MRIRNFFLDQGETLGGAEKFLLDFFGQLDLAQIKRLSPAIVGAALPAYQEKIGGKIPLFPFVFPSLKGGFVAKGIASFKLMSAANRLTNLIHRDGNSTNTQIFANTPRTIFVAYLAKKFFGLSGRFIVMIHDFTIPPRLLRRIANTADVIIANSVITRQTIRTQISSHAAKKIKIVENGVDFQAIEALKLPVVTNPKVERITLLGRIDPRKGQIFALEAADLLRERNPHLQFFIVGSSFPGDPATISYEKSLKKFVADRELDNVFFVPEAADPYEVFANSDLILALPTEPETFGRIVVEGLALGKIVIAFDCTGPKQILESFAQYAKISADFFLCESGNAMSLAEKIGFFADNPHELAPYQTVAQEFVRKHYHLEETAKRLWQVLTEK